MTRHCTRCDSEVEDVGGYCLLGHPLRLHMETASLDDLKREVEAAFETAQDEVRESLAPLMQHAEPAVAREAELVTAAAPAPAMQAAPAPAMQAAPAPAMQAAPAPAMQAAPPAPPVAATRSVPPPPPPQRRTKSKFEALWDGMEGGDPVDAQDPINAFAPPPRMDWGPERGRTRGRGLRRLRPTSA